MLKTQAPARLAKPAYDLDALRALFPHTEEIVYLNHAAVSPQATPVREAQIEIINALSKGTLAFNGSNAIGQLYDGLYASICQLINAEKEELSLVQNTGLGLNIIALGLKLPAASNIVICDVEYPANVYPWMHIARQNNLEVRRIPADNGGLTVAALDRHADENTALVAVSTLQFATGHLTDLVAIGEWCKAREILFCVDGIQSIAHNPLDVRAAHVDFLATGGMKSMMGPLGIGFIFIRQALLAEHGPSMVGTSSMTDFMNFTNIHWDLRPEAARYELGTPNIVGMAGLKASLNMLLPLGIDNIGEWTHSLARALIDDLTVRGYEVISPYNSHGSIVIFSSPNLEEDIAKLTDANICVVERGGNIRVSLHCYNTYEEIYRVGEVLGDK